MDLRGLFFVDIVFRITDVVAVDVHQLKTISPSAQSARGIFEDARDLGVWVVFECCVVAGNG